MPREKVRHDCGSRSTSSTRWPRSCSATPSETTVVVLATPPFWLAIASVVVIAAIVPLARAAPVRPVKCWPRAHRLDHRTDRPASATRSRAPWPPRATTSSWSRATRRGCRPSPTALSRSVLGQLRGAGRRPRRPRPVRAVEAAAGERAVRHARQQRRLRPHLDLPRERRRGRAAQPRRPRPRGDAAHPRRARARCSRPVAATSSTSRASPATSPAARMPRPRRG